MRRETVTDIPSWYAIHTHPKQENRAEENLKAWGMETFFPGYLFAKFALSSLLHKVRFTRGVHSVVCVGNDPAPVDDRVIEIIAAQIDTTGFVKIGAGLEPGANVMIQAGPFKGLTGIFEREASAADRIKILLDCVSFQARVEIDRNCVKCFRA